MTSDRALRPHRVRIARPGVPPHVLGPDLAPSEVGDVAPISAERIVPPEEPWPVMPAPQRGRFLTPAETRERIAYFRRWGRIRTRTLYNRRQMRREFRALKSDILLARLHDAYLRGEVASERRNRAWVEDETRQVERDLMAAMTVALPRAPDESREAWETRRRGMLAAWRDEPRDPADGSK